MRQRLLSILASLGLLLALAAGCAVPAAEPPVTLDNLPAYSGAPYVAVNGNEAIDEFLQEAGEQK